MTDPSVRNEIMAATYEALCEHGYTDLTAQNIADRTEKSKSLLFYHYDSKEDLIVDFVDYLLERFDRRVEENRDRPPVERLAMFVDWFLYSPDDEERTSFHTALLELRAQAPHNDRYREQLRKSDDRLRETLEEILADGLESGDFRDHEPAEMVPLLIAAFDGARIRQLTIGRDEYIGEVRSGTTDILLESLLTDGVAFPADVPAETGAETEPNANDERGETDAATAEAGKTDEDETAE